jgi:glycosyltransferase involved in cell wall biosynthesis
VAEPLHVAIDGRELTGRPTGVGRYLTEVMRAWLRAGGDERFSVVIPAEPAQQLPDPAGRITWIREPGAAGTLWEQVRLRRAVTRLSPDVLFAVGYTSPLLLRCPTVLVVHDVSFAAHPEWFAGREGVRRRWLTRVCARRAAVVVTVSEFSKREIVRWLHTPADRIVLAPPGVPDEPAGGEPDLREPASRRRVVLFVGSLFNRRRIADLVAGFAAAARRVPDARLVLVGDNRTSPRQDPLAIARGLGVGDRVEWHAWIDDTRLSAYYASARVFAFLSDYEGFGMTPFEAIAHGVPPVVLDTPHSREVYGDGARLVPRDAAAIGDALATLLTDDAAHRALLAAGRRQLARYSWERTASVLMDALKQAARR